jgi:hypothetical protein
LSDGWLSPGGQHLGCIEGSSKAAAHLQPTCSCFLFSDIRQLLPEEAWEVQLGGAAARRASCSEGSSEVANHMDWLRSCFPFTAKKEARAVQIPVKDARPRHSFLKTLCWRSCAPSRCLSQPPTPQGARTTSPSNPVPLFWHPGISPRLPAEPPCCASSTTLFCLLSHTCPCPAWY